jgi:3-isopropylmalate/(R)-2-methylmalate dehydratase large subunit
VVNVDFVMAQDGTSPLAIRALENMGVDKVFDPDKVAMVMAHSAPSPLEGVSALHTTMREFGKRTGIHIYDVGCGVCHQLVPEQGHVLPGDLMVGCDSHTCTYGALNVFSTGVGSTDGAAAMAAGKLWFRVPQSIKVVVNGELPKGVYAKDIILHLAGLLGADGANYRALEFSGPVIEALSVEARMTISNMAIELGAKAGLLAADDKTLAWCRAHGRAAAAGGRTTDGTAAAPAAASAAREPRPVAPDADAHYERVVELDASTLVPQVAKPHTVDNVAPVTELVGTPIQEGVLGTCTNGRLEDLEVAARLLAGKHIAPDVRFIVAPASKQIYLDAMAAGYIQTFVEAGACVVTPGCGPCVGTHNGVPSDGENVITTANRNFRGRMGNSNAFIYLASPATVAASVLAGAIADPRTLAG